MAVEYRRCVYTSGWLFVFWLLYAIYSTVPVYTYDLIYKHYPVTRRVHLMLIILRSFESHAATHFLRIHSCLNFAEYV